MGSGRTGHLLAQGSREFPKGPLRQLLVPLEGKGGGALEAKEVQRAGDWRPRFWGAPPPQRRAASLRFRGCARRARWGRYCLAQPHCRECE